MLMYAINKSNTVKKVWRMISSPLEEIGSIYHNECYAITDSRIIQGSDGSYHEYIYFKSTDGMKHGVITNGGDGEATPFLNYSFGNVTVNNSTYSSFKTRKALAYYDASGTYKGTCVSGARVLTNDTTPGQSMPHCMRAMYVETGVGTNVWRAISGTNGTYGFIDTGISGGSDAARIGIYGNW